MRFCLVVAIVFLLSGCNALIGIPETTEEQPWRTIYLLSFFAICLIPILSVLTLTTVRLFKPVIIKRRTQLQLFTAILFAVMLVMWLLLELSLPQSTNIRIDLFIVVPALLVQTFLIAISSFFYAASDDSNSKSNKSRYSA